MLSRRSLFKAAAAASIVPLVPATASPAPIDTFVAAATKFNTGAETEKALIDMTKERWSANYFSGYDAIYSNRSDDPK